VVGSTLRRSVRLCLLPKLQRNGRQNRRTVLQQAGQEGARYVVEPAIAGLVRSNTSQRAAAFSPELFRCGSSQV